MVRIHSRVVSTSRSQHTPASVQSLQMSSSTSSTLPFRPSLSTPASQIFSHHPAQQQPTSLASSSFNSPTDDAGDAAFESYDIASDSEDEEGYLGGEELAAEEEQEQDEREQDAGTLAELSGLLGQVTVDVDEGATPTRSSPIPPSESLHPTIDTSRTIEGRLMVDPQHPRDFLGRWPHPIPEYLLSPFGIGSLLTPYDDPFLSFSDHDIPLSRRILPLSPSP